jgi:hypothetical protein
MNSIVNLQKSRGKHSDTSSVPVRPLGSDLTTHRNTIHQIINRLGIDSLIAQIARLREDDQFRTVGPDTVVQASPLAAKPVASQRQANQEEAEIWFDWAFVDFWKSNYCKSLNYRVSGVFLTFWAPDTVQRALPTNPNQVSASAGICQIFGRI